MNKVNIDDYTGKPEYGDYDNNTDTRNDKSHDDIIHYESVYGICWVEEDNDVHGTAIYVDCKSGAVTRPTK